ncbi:hypothetical protein B0J13DRAFT_595923 [Dactylonectria estremocensis]|uniref:3-hydroxyisobutyrate dehydrogenase protein n=1 Tax=Dactylonectria estremocensis TaxID=1079267 RepID=A0A9P9J6K3_9HYPO|nr:hypothetical protein B0J13DRAFT_595923 [Dactylonectria estremocensis]
MTLGRMPERQLITYAPRTEREFPVNLMGRAHFFESRTVYRWRNPSVYQQPGHTRSDRYLHHNDGYLRNLHVACTDDIYTGSGNSTWKRTYVRKVTPLKVRLATWVVDFSYDPESWADWSIMILRALPAAFAMTFVFWDGKSRIRKRQSLSYAPVLYCFHGNAKVWSNMLENQTGRGLLARDNQVYRLLRPRYLCFLNEPFNGENCGTDIQNSSLNCLFFAYSTQKFSHSSDEDLLALHEIAETACWAAKFPAYWIACSYMQDPSKMEADIYQISDVLRGADSMIIAVERGDTEAMLHDWGSRMWMFPEVHTRDDKLQAPRIVAKNQFASQVWTEVDPDMSRHLIDHHLGNITLSQLELSALALRCLYSRHTTEYFQGDQAYALMGLLRLRPRVDSADTAFHAFFRLSLANDSEKLLERYICTLHLNPDQSWHGMQDAYQSTLWDMTPNWEVGGIADDDNFIIDVYWFTGPSLKRSFSQILVEWNGMFLIIVVILLALGAPSRSRNPGLIAVAVIFLLIFLYIVCLTTELVRVNYGGKFHETQAEMFGLEGHLNAATIERSIFGGNFSQFTWSPNSSPLSRSRVNEYGEREGMDPYKDPVVRMKVEAAKKAQPGDMRIFTLVDTYNMQLILFEAVRPPVTLMFCASEGGMQRQVGCSYEWETQTMYRETVLGLPTTSLSRMDRVP